MLMVPRCKWFVEPLKPQSIDSFMSTSLEFVGLKPILNLFIKPSTYTVSYQEEYKGMKVRYLKISVTIKKPVKIMMIHIK